MQHQKGTMLLKRHRPFWFSGRAREGAFGTKAALPQILKRFPSRINIAYFSMDSSQQSKGLSSSSSATVAATLARPK